MKKAAIFISGRGSNMESILKKSKNENLEIDFIILSDNPNAEGLKIAEKMGTKTFVLHNAVPGWKMTCENENEILDILRENDIELIMLAGFMRVITKKIVDLYMWKIINIHPSLLPSFKGRDAQKQAFEYGVKISGCTVHFVDCGVDTGPVIMQRCADISKAENLDEVKEIILNKEHELYFEAMKLIIKGEYDIKKRRVDFDN